MNNLLRSLALAGTMGLAACQSAPEPKAVSTAPPAPEPSPYRWTHGHSEKGQQALLATFGKPELRTGEFYWSPTIAPQGDTRIVVDLRLQVAYVWRDDQLIGASTISSGKRGKETPLGFWKILEKKRFHRSRKYDDAPMPFMQRIDKYGIALHAGALPGYPASHGCVRLPAKFAEKLFTLTKLGTEVVIEG